MKIIIRLSLLNVFDVTAVKDPVSGDTCIIFILLKSKRKSVYVV